MELSILRLTASSLSRDSANLVTEENSMARKLISAVAAAALIASSTAALAGESQEGALAPGAPAGVHEAEIMGMDTATVVLISAGIIAVIAIAVANSGNHSSAGTH
jgi:hypothetical protein